jgi:glycosyltransferase involved in cell wall biosynthesis
MEARPRILVLNPYFLPSRKGGGSVTALQSLVQELKADHALDLAVSAYDLHAEHCYALADQTATRARCGVDIHYLPRGYASVMPMARLLAQPWDLIYINSFLSLLFSALPLLLLRLRRAPVPVLLAPRGELMAGALAQRRGRKLAYLRTLHALGLLRGVQFHATSEQEASELAQHHLGPVHLAADLPPLAAAPPRPTAARIGEPLRCVFLSRVEPKKNLLFALEVLSLTDVPVILDIVGPIGDAAYWGRCQEAMRALPECVQVRYLGAVPPEQVAPTLAGYELLLFPTLAENNGYVIHEALLAGCSLLISEHTPWRGLRQLGLGADLPLDAAKFTQALTDFAHCTPAERLSQRERAQAYGMARLAGDEIRTATRTMLQRAMATRRA